MTETIIVNHKRHQVTRQKCTTRLIKTTAIFTTALARATLMRGRVVYATGTARPGRLVLHARRAVRAGRYTLLLRRLDRGRWRITRGVIAIG